MVTATEEPSSVGLVSVGDFEVPANMLRGLRADLSNCREDHLRSIFIHWRSDGRARVSVEPSKEGHDR